MPSQFYTAIFFFRIFAKYPALPPSPPPAHGEVEKVEAEREEAEDLQ